MLIKNAYVYRNDTRTFEKNDILIKNGIITDIGNISCDTDIIDASEGFVVPGLIDVHTHGRAGGDFYTAVTDLMVKMLSRLYSGDLFTIYTYTRFLNLKLYLKITPEINIKLYVNYNSKTNLTVQILQHDE